MPGVKDRTSEFLKEVELSSIETGDKNGKNKTKRTDSSNKSSNRSSLKQLKKKLLVHSLHSHSSSNNNSDLENDSAEEDVDLSKFLSLVANTRQLIDQIRDVGQKINTKSVTLVNSPFQDETKKTEVEELISTMKTKTRIINLNLKRLKELIQKEESQLPIHRSSFVIPNELRIRRTQYLVMVNDFKDTLSSFHSESATTRSKCLHSIQNRLSITGSTKTAEEVEDLMEQGNWSIFTDGLLMDTQIAKDALDQLESRCKFILQLEAAVTELHEMFIHVGMLVEAQGDMIDSIESQVKNTQNYIEKAENQLVAARKSKKRARRCKVIAGVAGTVGVVIVCMIVFI